MFRTLSKFGNIDTLEQIQEVLLHPAFSSFSEINVLPLIYDEHRQRCNILVFDYAAARANTTKILRRTEGRGRKHPVFVFLDSKDEYVCEVRYGDATANALQRGLWTHTRNALKYFDSITGGWINYAHNLVLVKLFSHALVSSSVGHELALENIRDDIMNFKQETGL
ncbi:MAG: hypothetical protein OHK0021_02250 [Bryobacter sp.]